jgi:hypothetical protein
MTYAKIELTYYAIKEIDMEVDNAGNFQQQIEGAIRDFLNDLKEIEETEVNLYILHKPCYGDKQ